MIKDSDRATRLPLWGLAYLNPPNPLFKGAIRAFGRKSKRVEGLLVAIHTWSSSGAARKLQTTNYLAKIRVKKIVSVSAVTY